MNIFELVGRLTLDKSEYEEGLNEAEKDTEGFGSKMGNTLGTVAKVGGASMLALGSSVALAGTALVNNMGEVGAYGDSIDKLSQKMGISAQAYQEWDFIAQHSGTSMASLRSSFKTLSTAVQSGSADFEALGISLEEASAMSTEDLFGAVIAGLQNMEEGTERTALASKLLGRGAMELGALLNTSAEDTEAMRQQVHELGGVMSDDAVKASAQYQDALQNMQTAMTGLKNNMVADLLPSASAVAEGLGKIFAGDFDTGLDQISTGVTNLANQLAQKLPQIVKVGAGILETIAQAIITNLPVILPTLIQLVKDIANMLLENLPLLIETGVELMVELVQGLAEMLPEIIPTLIEAIVNLIPTVIDAVVDALPLLIDGAIQLVIGLVEALPTIIQTLIDALPTIITSIVNALITCLPQLIQGAITLVTQLVTHLPEIIMALIQAIPQIIMAIIEGFAPLATQLGEVASNAITAVGNWFAELPSKLAYWAGEAIASVIKFFTELPSKIKEWFDKTIEKVVDFGTNFKNKAIEAGKDFFDNLVNAIKGLPDKVTEIGRNIVDGLKNGIKEKWDALVSWFTDLGQDFIAGFKSVFGIASPSKVFAQIGGFMAEGLGVGWDDKFDDVRKNIENVNLDMDVAGSGDLTSGMVTTRATSNDEIADLLRAILNRMPSDVDPNSIFKFVKTQNEEYKNATGVSAFA